jgi:hypothetical protein
MLQIVIESSAGVPYGTGPITSALNVEYTQILDGAGEWSMNIPAADDRTKHLAHDRIVVAQLLGYGSPRVLFRGPIRDIKQAVSAGTAVYQVRGEDELGLLSEVLVWDTYQQISWDTPLQVQEENGSGFSIPDSYDDNLATFGGFYWDSLSMDYFVYVRFYAQVNGLRFDIAFTNKEYAILTVQYYNGSGWDNVSGLSDGTDVGGVTMAQDGDVVWTRPDDEVELSHNAQLGYWVRMHVNNPLDADLSTPGQQAIGITEIDVRYIAPETDEIADLLTTHAPAGWDTNGTYFDGTVDGTIDKFEGETVLESLVRIAKRAGEHFRLSATSKRVDWLRTTTPDSGLTAVASNHERIYGSDACLIQSLDIEASGGDRVTRVYAYAAGGGDAATDLSEAGGVTLPTGFTLETDAGGRYYLKNGTLETSIGRAVTRRLDIPDLVPLYGTGQNKKTSEALARATLAYMQQRATIQNIYRVRLGNVRDDLRVGDTIRIVYHGVTSDGTQLVNLNDSLIILRLTVQISRAGVAYDLLLSNVARLPVSDETILAEVIQQMRTMKRRPQPVHGRQVSGLQSSIIPPQP